MATPLQPSDVFTPATPVQEDMFAARRHEDLENRVAFALSQAGRQVVLFGDTGVGKTSLVNHLARKKNLVRVEFGPSFDEILQEAVAQVEPSRAVKRDDTTTVEVEAGGGVPGLLKAGTKATTGEKISREPTARLRTADAIETLERHDVDILFLDNYENNDPATHAVTGRAVSQMLKSVSDLSMDGTPHLKIVVAGIPAASEALLALDEATARRVAQIEVPRMPLDELDDILAGGEKKLGIAFGGTARHMILAYSDGFPYYTHLLALHCANRTIKDGRHVVDLADFDEALSEIIADCDLVLRKSYAAAIETTGEVKIRKSILEAVAAYNEPEVRFADIREGFLKIHPEYKTTGSLNFLSTAIRPLKEDYRVLSDRGLKKSMRNLYRFTNPLMRGYVRLQMRRDKERTKGFWDPEADAPPFDPADLRPVV